MEKKRCMDYDTGKEKIYRALLNNRFIWGWMLACMYCKSSLKLLKIKKICAPISKPDDEYSLVQNAIRSSDVVQL